MSFHVWAIYDHPKDYPDKFVARMWIIEPIKPTRINEPQKVYKETPTNEVLTSDDLDCIERVMKWKGLVKLPPMVGDDPVIIATWV